MERHGVNIQEDTRVRACGLQMSLEGQVRDQGDLRWVYGDLSLERVCEQSDRKWTPFGARPDGGIWRITVRGIG